MILVDILGSFNVIYLVILKFVGDHTWQLCKHWPWAYDHTWLVVQAVTTQAISSEDFDQYNDSLFWHTELLQNGVDYSYHV